jgi:hypothetical protein
VIPELEPRLREVGRIRIGAPKGPRPVALETFRLTSFNLEAIVGAAKLWGGTVEAWADAPTEGEQYQVTTEAAELPVLVAPQDVRSGQYYEKWSGGGCQRRCDGTIELLTGGPCLCVAEGFESPADRPCAITTHLLLILPQLPDVGVWRISTHGYNAAVEWPATVDMLLTVAEGKAPGAILGIEGRTSRQGGETRHFPVPVLRLPHALEALVDQAGPIGALPTAPGDGPVTEQGAGAVAAPIAANASPPGEPESAAGAGAAERAGGGEGAGGRATRAPACAHVNTSPSPRADMAANGWRVCDDCPAAIPPPGRGTK